MSKAGILTLMVLFLSLHDARGKPLSDDDFADNSELIRNARTFGSNLLGTPLFRHIWMTPIRPNRVSISNLFKDDTNDMTVLMNKVETMEENQEKILELLRQLTEAPKATPCIPPTVPTSNHSEKVPEDIVYNELKPTIIDILNSKEETHENTNQYEMSDSKNKVNDDGSLSITFNGNGTIPMQTANEVVVKPLESNYSHSELNSNENNDKELMDELEILENYSTNETDSSQSNNVKLDSNENNHKELMDELETLGNYSTNEKESSQSNNLKLDSNENNDKELMDELEILGNYSTNENESSQSNNLKLDSNENNHKELMDELEIIENYSTNEKESSQSNNLKLDSNEKNHKELTDELQTLENYSTNEKGNSQSNNLELDSNKYNVSKEVESLIHSKYTKLEQLINELKKLENYSINEKESLHSNNLK